MANQNDEETNVQDGEQQSDQPLSLRVLDDMQSTGPEILDADVNAPEVFDSARNDLHSAVNSLTYDGECLLLGDAPIIIQVSHKNTALSQVQKDARDASGRKSPTLSEDTVWVGAYDVNRYYVSL